MFLITDEGRFFGGGAGVGGDAFDVGTEEVGGVGFGGGSGEAVTSSKVAAGLLTPVTGRFLARSWRLDEVLPAAERFYAEVESVLASEFFHRVPVVRFFRSEVERERYEKRVATGELEGLVREITTANYGDVAHAPFGGIVMERAGFLDVAGFTAACQGKWGVEEGRVEEEELEQFSGGVRWKGVEAGTVVFCQGFGGTQSGIFSGVPFDPAKGEILDLKVPQLGSGETLNRGCWLVPLGDGRFRAGATYDRERLDFEPTEGARAELEEKLRGLLRVDFEITGQRAAVRPIVRGHHPVAGRHPEKREFAIFNGLASKGVLNGPFFARNLARHLVLGEEIDPDVDVSNWLREL